MGDVICAVNGETIAAVGVVAFAIGVAVGVLLGRPLGRIENATRALELR